MPKFESGKSGNPSGRPPGIRDRRTVLRDHLEASAPRVIETVISAALAGDISAAKLLLDKIVPSLKSGDLPVRLGEVGTEPAEILDAAMSAMSAGRISPGQAERITGALLNQVRIKEAQEFEERLERLEQQMGGHE